MNGLTRIIIGFSSNIHIWENEKKDHSGPMDTGLAVLAAPVFVMPSVDVLQLADFARVKKAKNYLTYTMKSVDSHSFFDISQCFPGWRRVRVPS